MVSAASQLEVEFEQQLALAGLPPWEQEYKFDPARRWRFDFAWPAWDSHGGGQVAVEIEGGAWAGGRHTTGSGFAKDCEKYNAAALAGWVVLRFTGDMVKDGRALEMTKRALE